MSPIILIVQCAFLSGDAGIDSEEQTAAAGRPGSCLGWTRVVARIWLFKHAAMHAPV